MFITLSLIQQLQRMASDQCGRFRTQAAFAQGDGLKALFERQSRGGGNAVAAAVTCPVQGEESPGGKLLEAVGKGTKAMHRYIALRRRMLGVKELNMYRLL